MAWDPHAQLLYPAVSVMHADNNNNNNQPANSAATSIKYKPIETKEFINYCWE
ncbi:hypothetical protein MY8738_007854 [Beauveria namnaoensis]